MHKDNVGELFGHLEHGVHIAVTGCKYQVVIFSGHIEHDTLGIRPFRDSFDK